MDFFSGRNWGRLAATCALAGAGLQLMCSGLRAGEPVDLAWGESELEVLQLTPLVEAQPWRFAEFPILAWRGPPGTAALEDFRAYKEAGFNLHVTPPDEAFHLALDFVSQAGLYSMPLRARRNGGPPAAAIDFDLEGNRRSIVGWIAAEALGRVDEMAASLCEVNRLMLRDPSRWALVALPPLQRIGQSSLENVVRHTVRAGMPLLNYPPSLGASGRSVQGHFDHLEALRRVSLAHDLSFWASVVPEDGPAPSESELRWRQFTSLAYGAKGLTYANYWGEEDGVVSVVDGRSKEKSDLYECIRAGNREVLRVGEVLLRLTNLDVVHTDPPPGHRAFRDRSFWIERVEGKDLLIGFFKDDSGGRYAMVVNTRHDSASKARDLAATVTLRFDREVASVEALSWLDGTPGPLELKDGAATLDIAGGTGVLLRATP